MSIPENPITRKEHFLARATGQDVSTPEPITREEQYLNSLALQVPQTLIDDIADLKSAIETKAEIDGYYEDMTVGDAEQLISTQRVTDTAPYSFRTTGGSADVGNREYVRKIVGGTVAKNQLVQNGNFADGTNGFNGSNGALSASSGVLTFTATESTANKNFALIASSAKDSIVEHKYLYSFYAKISTISVGTGFAFMPLFGNGVVSHPLAAQTDTLVQGIRLCGTADKARTVWYPWGTGPFQSEGTETAQIHDYMLIDLTAMLGSTIADYLYTLEQTTAGSGVAKLKEWGFFHEDYIPYQEPTLESVAGVTGHETVGFNAYDPDAGTARLVGGMQYQITGTYTAISIDGTTVTPDSDGYFTPSKDCTLTVTGGNATDTCVHLVWSGTHDGEYLPYEKHTYALDADLTLRGIPKLDASNHLYYDGDEYYPDGTVQRRYGVVDLGTLNWEYSAPSAYFYASVTGIKTVNVEDVGNGITSQYKNASFKSMYNHPDGENNVISYTNQINNRIYVRNTAYPDAATFKAAMSGVMLVYELATPTTETAIPYPEVQLCDDWGTESFTGTSPIPVGHTTEFPANLRDKLQHLPKLASADGQYLIQQTGTQMSLVPLAEHKELPDMPTTDGTYDLVCTVADGTATLTWEART